MQLILDSAMFLALYAQFSTKQNMANNQFIKNTLNKQSNYKFKLFLPWYILIISIVIVLINVFQSLNYKYTVISK